MAAVCQVMVMLVMTLLCQGEGSAVLAWDDAELLQQVRHKHVWDLVHRVVLCPIAKVEYSTVKYSAVQYSTLNYRTITVPAQVASTSWFVNFLQMSGVEQESIGLVMEKIGGRCRWQVCRSHPVYLALVNI